MAKLFYKSLIKLAQLRLIVVVVNVNLYDKSLFVQLIPENFISSPEAPLDRGAVCEAD